jgi:hypothetical protein
MARLTLVGTVHGDHQGFARTACLLRLLQPDLVIVELSPYAKTFRDSNQISLQRTLNRNLRAAASGCGLPFGRALAHPEIKAIRRQLVLPFEYRAARRFSQASGSNLSLVDYSPFSRKMINMWPEMLSSTNLAFLLSLPRDVRPPVAKMYDWAAGTIRGKAHSPASMVERADAEAELIWEQREGRMAHLIRSILHRTRPLRAVHLGGWQHLAVGGSFPSLRELLGIELGQCYLLDRGFL